METIIGIIIGGILALGTTYLNNMIPNAKRRKTMAQYTGSRRKKMG